ncbi:MAG: carbohydrate binding domain-containing protein, partial [Flavobacteriaceae bacterium]|nr:carbohydrate binding domain-containing protein [Flavobacteriaceae bacterium]
MSQESAVQLRNSNFEDSSIKPWEVIGNGAVLAKSNAHSGNQALELSSGTIVQANVKLKPSSSYKLTGWLKTESGSDEVRFRVNGLGEHNTETASALANWKKVELKFATGTEQPTAIIEIQNQENTAKNRAWADDLSIEYLGKYTPAKNAGIKQFAPRITKTDLGISQQP